MSRAAGGEKPFEERTAATKNPTVARRNGFEFAAGECRKYLKFKTYLKTKPHI